MWFRFQFIHLSFNNSDKGLKIHNEKLSILVILFVGFRIKCVSFIWTKVYEIDLILQPFLSL